MNTQTVLHWGGKNYDRIEKLFALYKGSKTVLDSGFHTVDSGFFIRGTRIPDFTSKNFQGSEFHQQKFPGFENPDSLTSGHVVIRP